MLSFDKEGNERVGGDKATLDSLNIKNGDTLYTHFEELDSEHGDKGSKDANPDEDKHNDEDKHDEQHDKDADDTATDHNDDANIDGDTKQVKDTGSTAPTLLVAVLPKAFGFHFCFGPALGPLSRPPTPTPPPKHTTHKLRALSSP